MLSIKRILLTLALMILGSAAIACAGQGTPADTGATTQGETSSAIESRESEPGEEAVTDAMPDTVPEATATTEPATEAPTEPETVFVSVATDKTVYEVDEDIRLTVTANPGDTVGFYPAGFDVATQKPIYYGTFAGEAAIQSGVETAVTALPGQNRREPEVAFYYGVIPVGDYKVVVTNAEGTVLAQQDIEVVFTSKTIRTGAELAAKCLDVALNYKTLYVNGCFGAPMTDTNKARYTQNTAYNRQPERQALINAATADTFGFDCVCLIKGLLWGWEGDLDHVYGGAAYQSNGVADITEGAMLESCDDISRKWTEIEVGEVVWLEGHIGVYVGNGLAVECTPAWDDCVQITAANNSRNGFHTRTWSRHGKLPYLAYTGESESVRVG